MKTASKSEILRNIYKRPSLQMLLNPFQPSVAFNTETSHLFCYPIQMTGFYMKRNTGLTWVDIF